MTRQLEVVDAELLGQVLQLAVVVGHADRADVVALGEQHLGDRPAVLGEPLRVGGDLHALVDARRCRPAASFVEPATSTRHRRHAPDVGQPVEVAQRRDVDAVLAWRRRGSTGPRGAPTSRPVDRERVDGPACRAPPVTCCDRADARGADVRSHDVREVLLAEVAERAEDRVRGRLAQAAQAGRWTIRTAAPAAPGRPCVGLSSVIRSSSPAARPCRRGRGCTCRTTRRGRSP